MSTTPRHIAREQRLARIRAARTEAPAYETLTIKAEEIRPGDFLEQIPTQERVRGAKVDATVDTVTCDTTWSRSTGRGRRMPVSAVRVTFAVAAADAWTPEVSVPAHFKVTVRRPAA